MLPTSTVRSGVAKEGKWGIHLWALGAHNTVCSKLKSCFWSRNFNQSMHKIALLFLEKSWKSPKR